MLEYSVMFIGNGHDDLNQLRENLAEKNCEERISETILYRTAHKLRLVASIQKNRVYPRKEGEKSLLFYTLFKRGEGYIFLSGIQLRGGRRGYNFRMKLF